MTASRVLAASAAVVAVHAATDSFFAPEPGTSWRDHLVRGLVTLAVLAGAVAVFGRLRAGARAAVAATLGILALEGAMLGAYDARAVGARGEDWTAFLLFPAAAASLGLAVALLWRSRKRRGHTVARRALAAAATVVGAFWIVAPLAMAIGGTHRPRAHVDRLDLGRPYEEVTIRTSDGLDLAGWYVPSRNRAAVISFPTRRGKPAQARMLVRHGYGVLALDMRGYDGSDGDANAFGWGSVRDIDAAVAWLAKRSDVVPDRIGGIGFSVGGEQMLEAAAENPRLRAVVSEGAGERSVRESLLRGWSELPSLPKDALQTAALAVLAGRLPPPSLEDAARRIAPRAVFLIYAGRGTGGEELNEKFFAAAGEPKQLWRIADSGHVGGLDAEPREYEQRVVRFFDRALLHDIRS